MSWRISAGYFARRDAVVCPKAGAMRGQDFTSQAIERHEHQTIDFAESHPKGSEGQNFRQEVAHCCATVTAPRANHSAVEGDLIRPAVVSLYRAVRYTRHIAVHYIVSHRAALFDSGLRMTITESCFAKASALALGFGSVPWSPFHSSALRVKRGWPGGSTRGRYQRFVSRQRSSRHLHESVLY